MKARPSDAGGSDTIQRARRHFTERAWADAHEAFSASERAAPLEAEDLERFATAIAALAIPHADSPTGFLTVSCGAIVRLGGDLSPKRLLQLGDEALYAAKQAGRNRYVIRKIEA